MSPPSFSSFPDLYSHSEPRQSSTKHAHKTKSKKHRPAKEDQNNKQQNVEKPEFNRFFYSDRKGDSLNVQYDGLHAGDIPKYRIVGGGRNVLGLPNSYVVLRRAGKGIEVGPSNYRRLSNLTASASRTLLSQPPSRRLLPSKDSSKYAEIDGFIPIPSRRGMSEDNEPYRSLSRVQADDNSNPSSPSESDDDIHDDSDTPVLSAHQEMLKLLEQELETNPRAVSKWLALLNQTLSTIPLTSKNATKARSEITVSIIAHALSADPQNNLDRRLRLTYLRAGEDIWHESKLRSEWEDALKVGGVDIQLEWLEWKIRNGNKGIDGVLESAARALTALGIGQEAEIGKVRIFWRVAVAIKNAGYSERAMAMFQAQAELTFSPPPNIAKMSFNAQLVNLEEFWDTECPRRGEEGAEGWASWYSTKKDAPPLSSETPLLPNIPDLDPYRQWASEESQADLKLYLPTRAISNALDPYCIVLLADIRPMLLNIQDQRAKHGFRMAWLSFLGLHIPGFSLSSDDNSNWDDRWNAGYLAGPTCLHSLFPSETTQKNLLSDSVAGVIVGRERAYSTPFGPVRYWGCDVSRPLDLSSGEPGRLPRRILWTADDIADVDANIVRRLFTGLRFNRSDPEWDVLSLAFEAAFNTKSALKLSKSFLSIYRNSLEHWNAHAQLERLRGRLGEARKIYQSILIISRLDNARPGEDQMWWNWAEMEWLDGGDEQALNVILSSVRIEGPATGITILRTKRSLEDMIASTKLSSQGKEYEAWIKLRALLDLLTSQDLTAALANFDEPLEEGSCPGESLMTAALILLYLHSVILKRPTPPSILRERAGIAVEVYPSNSILLGIFLEAEKGQGIWGRVRTMLGSNDGRVKDVARRAQEVWLAGWQEGRWQSEVERTRNGLAAAVEHERTRGSFVIWRIYIEFEIRVKDLQRAKKLLFRAIGECPLVKELYLLAFGPLRSVFQVHELNALAETMAERGIRLRRGLEDMIEKNAVEADGQEDNESEDEIEHNARELRRLKPY